jgi:hypothetical protein
MKYFFACVKYTYPEYGYMGVHNTYCFLNGYKKNIESGVFALDNYPTKQEIINNLIQNSEECIDIVILSYNELNKDQYDTFNQ